MEKTKRGLPGALSQTPSTSESGTTSVAIFKPAGWTASILRFDRLQQNRQAYTFTPLPISRIADEQRSAAPGSSMVSLTARCTHMNKTGRRAVLYNFHDRHNDCPRTLPP